jgi:hypothetical protein
MLNVKIKFDPLHMVGLDKLAAERGQTRSALVRSMVYTCLVRELGAAQHSGVPFKLLEPPTCPKRFLQHLFRVVDGRWVNTNEYGIPLEGAAPVTERRA